MIRRLINKLQGKIWGAHCLKCGWTAGRYDLEMHQAKARADGHMRNASWMDYGDPHLTVIRKAV